MKAAAAAAAEQQDVEAPQAKKRRIEPPAPVAHGVDGVDLDEEDELRRLEGLPPLDHALQSDVGDEDGRSDASGSAAPNDLADGASTTVQGSGSNMYTLARRGDVYSCTCPAWRNQKGAGAVRTCKHLKAFRGEDAERQRVGSDKQFYATGNKVAGHDSAPAASSGAAPVNDGMAQLVALAESWEKVGGKDLTGWALSEKLDGMRCLWDGAGKLWSRTGKEVFAPPSFMSALPRGTVLDGELWLGRGMFQKLMTKVRRIDADETAWADVEYVVFDAPRAGGGIFERLEAAKVALAGAASSSTAPGSTRVRILEHEVCRGADHIAARHKEVAGASGEGLMARHPTAAFRAGRTSDLLKIKEAKDDEAIVTGHAPGKGKHEGRLGALECRLRDGTCFNVGTGFTDAERENPPKVGTVITFQYFEMTNGGVPRFPRWLRVRPDVSASEFPAA